MAKKPKFGDKQQTKGKVLKRAQKRAVRLTSAGKMPRGVSPKHGITGKEARALKAAAHQLKSGGGVHQPQRDQYDPLAPLTGKDYRREERAAEGYEFGDQQRDLQKEGSRLQQNSADVGSYFDDYKKALTESVGRIRNDADSTAAATQTQIQHSQEQDRARLEASDAEAAATAAKFGRPSTPSQEGQRALEARGFMAQSEAARQRERANAQVANADQKIPNSVLQKAERLREEERRIAANRGDQSRLTQKRGEFRTKYRADTRGSEREWAAVQKEFKLKAGESKADRKLKARELKVENIKSFRQLKQAMLYAGAKSHMADSLVKQAKIMRDAKVISAQQYREIAKIQSHKTVDVNNSYNGLGGGKGSGGRKLQPYERDRVDRAYQALNRQTGLAKNGQGWTSFVRRMRRYDITPQYARIAWEKYWKGKKTGGGGQPGAPHGGTRTN